MSRTPNPKKPNTIGGALLQYAPTNEFGVVVLFANLARKWRLAVDTIRSGFPDCIAYQRCGGTTKAIRIEFEFRSKSAHLHGDGLKNCDWIVCWEHNWPDAPKHLKIVELQREFGLGLNIWIMPVSKYYGEMISETECRTDWTVPTRGHKGDLLLFYHKKPEGCIKDVFKVIAQPRRETAAFRKNVPYFSRRKALAPKKDLFARIQRVCRLESPVFWEDLLRNKFLSGAGFVRGKMQGRPLATEHWPYLYDLVLRKNPSCEKFLAKYAPERL